MDPQARRDPLHRRPGLLKMYTGNGKAISFKVITKTCDADGVPLLYVMSLRGIQQNRPKSLHSC